MSAPAILFAPESSTSTYLMAKGGTFVNTWTSTLNPGMAVHLWPNGNLLRTEDLRSGSGGLTNPCGYPGGRIAVYAWDNTPVWQHDINTDQHQQTHDAYPMQNGNVLACVWEWIPNSDPQMRANCQSAAGGIWSGMIIELQPDGNGGATEVWRWRFWDHLLPAGQAPASMPQKLDATFLGSPMKGSLKDWTHMNALTYNEGLHQIIVSSRNLNEIYIIEHCQTTAIAAGGTGGRYGAGGDFLYRWGNPQAYGMGSASDQVLFGQHSPYWTRDDGSGNKPIVINNDGYVGSVANCQPTHSAARTTDYVQLVPPPFAAGAGNYGMQANQACGGTQTTLGTAPSSTYQCTFQGSAQLLNDGTLLVCTGASGYLFELDAAGALGWTYQVEGGAFRCHQYDDVTRMSGG